MSLDSYKNFIDDELYLDFESKYKKIFNSTDSNYEIMSDDTMECILGSILSEDNIETIDLSGLLLEGTLDISKNINNIIKNKNIKKLDCSNNYFDVINAYNPNIHIHDFVFDNNPVKKIYLPNSFNENIDFLPSTIEVLIFPHNSIFNKPINDLPTSLEVLSTGNSFNQTINNLPKNLINLMLGTKFNQPINKLPPNLKTLIFDELNTYEYKLNCLPDSLEFISLPINYDNIIISLPDECKCICFNLTNELGNHCQELKKKFRNKML